MREVLVNFLLSIVWFILGIVLGSLFCYGYRFEGLGWVKGGGWYSVGNLV